MYSFEDENKKSLYVGKSIHPKSRVRQHVRESKDARTKQARFVREARFLSFITVESELEAILLEAKLIRLHKPAYNSMLRDDKSALYIVISKQDFPEISLARKNDLKGSESYYGPFTSSAVAARILKIVRRIFHFCQTPPNRGAARPCFYYHLELCDGACVGKVTKKNYRKKVGYIKRFLGGMSKGVETEMLQKIKAAAKERRFEEAEEYRRMYQSLEMSRKSKRLTAFVESPVKSDRELKELRQVLLQHGVKTTGERIEGYDVATQSQTDTVGSMVVFYLGQPEKREYRSFTMKDWKGGDTGAMTEMFLRRNKKEEWPEADLIVVDGGKPQVSAAVKIFGGQIPIVGLAKREELLVIKKEDGWVELELPRSSGALKLLQKIRDESHRRATGHLNKRRGRSG